MSAHVGFTGSAASELAWHRLAAELAANRWLVRRLLARHQPDPVSGLCVSCTTPGRGTPRAPWPCALFVLAQHADEDPRLGVARESTTEQRD